MANKRGRVTKADLVWSAACIVLILLAHGLGYI
jgi:hypothetical protein